MDQPRDFVVFLFLDTLRPHFPDSKDHLMSKLPTEEVVLLSADSTVQPGDAALHPVEVLNTLLPQGLPKHRLTLRPGAILRLMRNLNPRDGLCNGTRMVFVGVINGKVGISILCK